MSHLGFSQQLLTEKQQKLFKDEVRAKANSTSTIMSDFTQTKHIGMLDENMVSKGNLAFQAPDQILWKYITPNPYKVVFKDEVLYVDSNGSKEAILLSRNKLFRSLNTLIAASIRGDMFNDDAFEMTYSAYNGYYLAKFIPKDKKLKRFVASFELKFGNISKEVTEVTIHEPNGDFTQIVFSNRKSNIKIAPKIFQH
ncbi:MAG: outer membrane lipoprotein carrier protein LolA [Marinirhabdus sp.]|nr:outer membrane lipoprotein carrier protein LolA [Marinirhabdus sp.]